MSTPSLSLGAAITMPRLPFVALLAVTVLSSGVSAQSGWDRYRPGKLSTIIATHRAELEADTASASRFAVSAQTFPTRAEVVFSGQTRPLAPDHQRVLRMWARMMGVDTTRMDDYREEWLFREGSLELWMPVQHVTAESMRSVAIKGLRVTVWAQWFGAVRREGRLSWVFPIMRTQTHATATDAPCRCGPCGNGFSNLMASAAPSQALAAARQARLVVMVTAGWGAPGPLRNVNVRVDPFPDGSTPPASGPALLDAGTDSTGIATATLGESDGRVRVLVRQFGWELQAIPFMPRIGFADTLHVQLRGDHPAENCVPVIRPDP